MYYKGYGGFMNLKEFTKLYLDDYKIDVKFNHQISKITDNSKEISKNSIFVCIDVINNFG